MEDSILADEQLPVSSIAERHVLDDVASHDQMLREDEADADSRSAKQQMQIEPCTFSSPPYVSVGGSNWDGPSGSVRNSLPTHLMTSGGSCASGSTPPTYAAHQLETHYEPCATPEPGSEEEPSTEGYPVVCSAFLLPAKSPYEEVTPAAVSWASSLHRPSFDSRASSSYQAIETERSCAQPLSEFSQAETLKKRPRQRPTKANRARGKRLAEMLFQATTDEAKEFAEQLFLKEMEGNELLHEYSLSVLRKLHAEAAERAARGEDPSMVKVHLR